MAAPAVVRGGRTVYLVAQDGRITRELVLGRDPADFARAWVEDRDALRREVDRWLGPPSAPVLLTEPWLLPPGATRAGGTAAIGGLRRVRELVPWKEGEDERATLLEVARRSLARELASPEQQLATLAREEERLARAVRREEEAGGQLLSTPTGEAAEYSSDQRAWLSSLLEHHASLVERVRRLASVTVPNLSAVLGGVVAARLVAAAGGTIPLSRMSASRLQLLGSRRRPGAGGDGPRFGLLYPAVHAPGLAGPYEGAYARSLAALAVIAARADAHTHRDISATLVVRRDRRLKTLRARSA